MGGCNIALSGDDCFAIWSIGALADNISFVNNTCRHQCELCPPGGCPVNCAHILPSGMVSGYGCSTQGNNAMITFGYGNGGHPAMKTCFGGVFSKASSTTVTGNVGGNQSAGKAQCVFYEERCPFPRSSTCT